jgi:hypothetical protein
MRIFVDGMREEFVNRRAHVIAQIDQKIPAHKKGDVMEILNQIYAIKALRSKKYTHLLQANSKKEWFYWVLRDPFVQSDLQLPKLPIIRRKTLTKSKTKAKAKSKPKPKT